MDVHDDLRRWARGLYPLEAARRAADSRLRRSVRWDWLPWIIESGDGWCVDRDVLAEECGALSGGEQRALRVEASLLDGPPVDLPRLSGIDHERQDLILAALRHSGGRRVWTKAQAS